MDALSYFMKLDEEKIETFTDDGVENETTNKEIDDNNDSIAEHESEVKEEIEERNEEVAERDSDDSDDESMLDEDDDPAVAEMTSVRPYSDEDLSDMNYKQISQILFLPYDKLHATSDASDLVILDSEIVNAGDEKQGRKIGDDSGGGGGGDDYGSDSGGGDDDFGDFEFSMTPFVENDAIPLTQVMFSGFVFLLKKAWALTKTVSIAFGKFCSLHVPRIITNKKMCSRLWEAKLSIILPRVTSEAINNTSAKAISADKWESTANMVMDMSAWVVKNTENIVEANNQALVDKAFSSLQSRLRDVDVDWDLNSINVDTSSLRGMREIDSPIALGYTQSKLPKYVALMEKLGNTFDKENFRYITDRLGRASDMTQARLKNLYNKATNSSNERIAQMTMREVEASYNNLRKLQAANRAAVEIAHILASDFQAVMRAYEIAAYKSSKDD